KLTQALGHLDMTHRISSFPLGQRYDGGASARGLHDRENTATLSRRPGLRLREGPFAWVSITYCLSAYNKDSSPNIGRRLCEYVRRAADPRVAAAGTASRPRPCG